ncbi:MAG: DUF2914 domain-containing protein [bacterium]|nr:DUF2914 domain-containing protein [bacterium]
MRKLRESLEENYRRISTAAILIAFIIDSVTLVRVDLYLTNLLLLVYLAIVGVGIVIINLYEDGRTRFISEDAYQWLFIAMQFSFGGLFGRFLIYYSRSGSLLTSWPFLLLLAGLLIGNEFSKKYYTRLVLQISFFFLALFSYLIFLIPVLVGRMGGDIFILSGYISLLCILSFLYLLSKTAPKRVNSDSHSLYWSIGAIFFLMNLFYFTNIIPPIPLSLREAGVYHKVIPGSTGYLVTHEDSARLSFLMPYEMIHIKAGGTLSAYSAIFAPTNFDTSIVHNWQFYNPSTEQWESRSKITLPIVGGRDNGYRGYSIKTNLTAGYWRVNMETLRGQSIGATKFKVEYVDKEPHLTSSTI